MAAIAYRFTGAPHREAPPGFPAAHIHEDELTPLAEARGLTLAQLQAFLEASPVYKATPKADEGGEEAGSAARRVPDRPTAAATAGTPGVEPERPRNR